MKYAAEMGSDAMTCIPSFIKTGSRIEGGWSGSQTQHCDIINLLLLFQNT
jgi:hypothetical protein